MNIYALQTARRGSKSVPNKNVVIINRKPCYKHNVDYAKESKYIKDIFITTDIPEILNKEQNVIKRPKHLCGDDASHYETILHGLKHIEKKINNKVDIIVVLLGNSIGAYPEDLDVATFLLMANNKADSIMSVGKYNMFNPFRAYYKNGNMLNTIMKQKTIKSLQKLKNINEKNSAGDVYFFNGSFWIIKRKAFMKNNGLLPFPWLGKNILFYEQDTKLMEIDAEWQLKMMQ